MHRYSIALPAFSTLLLALILNSATLVAQDDPKQAEEDPIAEKLSKAKGTYKDGIEKARLALVESFDLEITKVSDDSKLSLKDKIKTTDSLTAEKKAFEEDASQLPKHLAMKNHLGGYVRKLGELKKDCEKAYEGTARLYGDKKNFPRAKAVLEELEEFKKSSTVPTTTSKSGPTSPSRLAAARSELARAISNTNWSWVGNGATLFLKEDGSGTASDGSKINWAVLDENSVVVRWPSNHFDIFTFISADRKSFEKDWIGQPAGKPDNLHKGRRLDRK